MKKVFAGLLLVLGSVHGAVAGGLDISLSNESAKLSIMTSPFNARRPGGALEFSLGYLTNETGDNIFEGTLLARGVRQNVNGQYTIATGFKIVGGNLDIDDSSVDEESVGALALGFQAGVLLIPSSSNPLDLIVEGFLAPSITSFTDATEYSELGARIQVDVVPQARAYIGYRRVTWDTNDFKNVEVDRAVHVGINFKF